MALANQRRLCDICQARQETVLNWLKEAMTIPNAGRGMLLNPALSFESRIFAE